MGRIQANFNLYADDLARAVAFYSENFNFEFLGNIGETSSAHWAALKLENSIIWLGKNGASVGLILLIENNLVSFIEALKEKDIQFIIPENMNFGSPMTDEIMESSWGKHAWFIDSEKNVVMLFEPTV